jgi:nitrate reductase (cytochrome), electron transfer subunit
MKKLVLILSACLFMAPAFAQSADKAPDPLAGIKAFGVRGVPIDGPEAASDNFRNERDQAPLPRDFVQQPPLIPHTTKGYNITKNFNKCMDCHAWNRTKDTGATKVSVTHFRTREGSELSNISPRRYFCTQCHVPQTDAKPLVANKFQPATGMR